MPCRWHVVLPDAEQQTQVAEHLRRAADAGLPTALYLLALMTERGMGMPADRAAAIQLFRQAAEKGNRPSQARWGMALMQGSELMKSEGFDEVIVGPAFAIL